MPWILQTIWNPSKYIFRLFTSLRVTGKENIVSLKEGVIFVANHASEIDPILISSILNPFSNIFPLYYVAREKNFYTTSGWRQYFYGGLFFALMGAYPVFSGKKNYEKSLINHIKILSKQKSLFIFPEGKKTTDGTIRKNIHGGVAYLAWRTKLPVLPIAIKGTFQTTPSTFLSGKKKYTVSFGKPIYPTELFKDILKQPTTEDFKKAASVVMQEVKKMNKDM